MITPGWNRGHTLLAAGALAIWCLILALTWSTQPFWPDADGYTSHIAEGRWVAHPPCYMVFVATGRLFHGLGLPPYLSVQAAALFFTLAAWPVLYLLFRRTCETRDALLLVIAFAFSWNVLLLSHVGTSHAGDYFTVGLLLLIATSTGFREGRVPALALYGFALILCAGMRLNSAIMLIPLFAVVLLRHWRRIGLWITYFLAGVVAIAQQLLAISLYGGWQPYSDAASSGHAGNMQSSLLLSGINSATVLNFTRTFGWWALSLSVLLLIPILVVWNNARGGTTSTSSVPLKKSDGVEPVPPLRAMPAWTLNQRELLLYGGASTSGVLGFAALYLCTHPGFLCPALPGSFACLAALLPAVTDPARKTFLLSTAIALPVAFFLLVRPLTNPSTPFRAAANGLLLQYTGAGTKQSLFKTTSGWLRDAGYDALIPEHRRQALDGEALKKSNDRPRLP